MRSLHSFIDNPVDPKSNFNLGVEYESLNQTAAAASFYLRAAEKTNNRSLQYKALIRNAICFEKQGNRDLTIKTLLQRAISVLPNRPEAYYLLSKLYERRQEFHDCYTISSIGLENTNCFPEKLDEIPEYPGKYGLIFEKAVSGWWVGLNEQSRELMFDLYFNYSMDDSHRITVENNLNNLGFPKHKFIYTKSLFDQFKYKFNGLDKITNNYSQVYQDMFVLSILNGKTEGTYLEIGNADPYYNNNTALLETIFNWKGISIDINQAEVDKFNNERLNKSICIDALSVNYKKLLTDNNFNQIIDYLQIDCDPPEISFDVLKKVLDLEFKFRVITFEHDFYYNKEIRQKSRDYIQSYGYKLLVNDVSFNRTNSFEDWYILEEYVDTKYFTDLNPDVNYVEDIFYSLN